MNIYFLYTYLFVYICCTYRHLGEVRVVAGVRGGDGVVNGDPEQVVDVDQGNALHLKPPQHNPC